MLRRVSLVRKYENPMNNVFVEMIIIKYNVHVTMLFDAMVRGKSDYLICFTVGIVIENYTIPRIHHMTFYVIVYTC